MKKSDCPLLSLMRTHTLHYIECSSGSDMVVAVAKDPTGKDFTHSIQEIPVDSLPCRSCECDEEPSDE